MAYRLEKNDSQVSDETGLIVSPATEDKQDAIITAIGAIGGGIVWDTITATYPTTSSEVYTYTDGGTTTQVITVTYTDETKEVLSTVTKI